MTGQTIRILEDLLYISSQNRTLNLISNFRGIPINLSASIIRCSFTSKKARLCIHHRQIISLKATDQILVQSDLFPEMVVADIDQVNLQSKIINLQNLRYVTGSMGNRKNVRVQPENPLHTEIITSLGYNLLGEVIDISLDGLSIQLKKECLPHDNLIAPKSIVEIRLGLPGLSKNSIYDLNIQAEIAYIKEGQLTHRIGLLTFLKKSDQQMMRRYIFDRQTSILNEINQINNAFLQGVDV